MKHRTNDNFRTLIKVWDKIINKSDFFDKYKDLYHYKNNASCGYSLGDCTFCCFEFSYFVDEYLKNKNEN